MVPDNPFRGVPDSIQQGAYLSDQMREIQQDLYRTRKRQSNEGLNWMLFVDGENLTARTQAIAEEKAIEDLLVPGPSYIKDVFVWFPDSHAQECLIWDDNLVLRSSARRAYYYATSRGDGPAIQSVRQAIWSRGFDPVVFHKTRDRASKGVDITLARDVLCHAFRNNYDAAVLVAGDGDYVPLVEEVKRLGKAVIIWFHGGHASRNGLSPELPLAADAFIDMSVPLFKAWAAESSA